MNTHWLRWILVGFAALSIGCGTMNVKTNHPDAQIFLDGEYLGTGEVEVRSMGTPKTSTLTVVHNGQTAERTIRRSFTATTLVAGFFTYASGWIWGWEYPNEVVVELKLEEQKGWSAYHQQARDPWGTPNYEAPARQNGNG